MSIVIEAVNVTRSFRRGSDLVMAVNDINLRVENGELMAIVGRSGSGKTTLLNLLAGVDFPTSGEVVIAGKSISKMSDLKLSRFRNENIGMIFQNFNLIQELDVIENICLPIDLLNHKRDRDYLNQIIETMQLGDRLKHRPNQLSGGQQQRVAIARALIMKPSIVLADEPTANLDKKTGDDIFSFIEKANKEMGQTFIIATHNEEISGNCERVITLNDGRIVSDFSRYDHVGDNHD